MMPMMDFDITGYYRPKEAFHIKTKFSDEYPLYTDDVLTKSEDGTFTIHTGICVFGLKIDESKLDHHEGTAHLKGT